MRGDLHPVAQPRACIALFHGAGSNRNTKLLIALAEEFARHDVAVYRGDLPYRQLRPTGPPTRDQARDREGIRSAAAFLRERYPSIPVWIGGHSYGGRQASMLAAEDPSVADGLLLLSYPLHPPKKPTELRTAHLPSLRTPTLVVHGARDSFATTDEIGAALALIPARTALLSFEKLGHELAPSVVADVRVEFEGFAFALLGGSTEAARLP